MRIPKLVSIGEVETMVSVSIEDIICALNESDDSGNAVLSGLNSIAQFLKAISGERIEAMNQGQRDTIAAFLAEQSNRFKSQEAKP